MTCRKQQVICRIQAEDGTVVTGENYCRNPQEVCPREGMATGEGYHLCREVCQQIGHAEQVAVMNLQGKRGEQATLEGHTYACDDCKAVLRSAGVKVLHVEGREEQL